MELKDYYGILGLPASATPLEIKKAYRALAQQLHPDKKPGDPYAAAQFHEIKQAYDVLSNPSKKEKYLQQRWYNQSIGKRKTQEIITPVTVLKQALELEKYVSTLDVFRMDKQGLKEYILDLISDGTISTLHTFNEPETNREIISAVMRSLRPLPAVYSYEIIAQLYKLAGTDEITKMQLINFSAKTERNQLREKHSLIFIIVITVLLCVIIWRAGR